MSVTDLPDLRFNLLKALCLDISQNPDGHEHILALHQLLGNNLEKAFELIDKDCIEYVTTVDTKKSFFVVRRTQKTYYLYSTVLFCPCPHFRFNVMKSKDDFMCKHIIACHLGLAMKTCQFRTSSVYMDPSVYENLDDKTS